MPGLQIDFEDGFEGDNVVVSAAGRQLWRRENIRTNLAISLAAVAQVEVPDGKPVEVAVLSRGLTASEPVTTPFLRVSIVDGELELTASADPPLHA